MKRILTGTALALVAASGASAQQLSYGQLLVDYGSVDAAGNDVTTTTLGAELGMQIQEFDMWINATQIGVSPDGTPNNLTVDISTIGAGYTFNSTYRLDISSTDLGIGLGLGGINIGMDEIGVAYDNGQLFGRLSYAKLDQPSLPVDSITGLHVGYNFNEYANASISVHGVDEPTNSLDPIVIASAEYGTGTWGVNLEAATVNISGSKLSLASLGGNYQFNDQWGVYGAYTSIDAAGSDVSLIRIGATYDVSDQLTAFAGYSQADVDGTDVDGFNFGVSMDFGDKPASYETTADRLLGIVQTAGAYNF